MECLERVEQPYVIQMGLLRQRDEFLAALFEKFTFE
jgi:hypothetical protein